MSFPPPLRRLTLALVLLASIAGVSAWPLSPAIESRLQPQKALQPVPSDSTAQSQSPRKLQGRFLHISDFHPDEFYRAHSSAEEGLACHRGEGSAGPYGAETTDCDTPYSLVNATFKWIEQHVRDDVDFVIWTGDSARHDGDEEHPRHEADVVASNRFIADKFVDTFAASGGRLSVPVIPTFGNNDFLPHNVMAAGPNKWFRTYTHVWRRFIPEEQRHTFGLGGWFSVEVIPDHLAVFSLNTMYFFDRNPAVDGCAHPDEPGYKQLDWLRIQLQLLRDRGMKAILMGHVPPARTQSKQLWDETCWQKYTLWLMQYRDVVTLSLYGHMNIDHFLLQDTADLQPTLGVEGELSPRHVPRRARLGIQSKEDYLQELRDRWADLPNSVVHVADVDGMDTEDDAGDNDEGWDVSEADSQERGGKKKKKKKKGKKKHPGKYHDIGGKYAERFQLALISPSIVPNYFPTMRIVEYNITGLEDAPVWKDPHHDHGSAPPSPLDPADDADEGFEKQDADLLDELQKGEKDNKKKKKGKGKPGRKPPEDHNLIIPEGPAKGSPPGPAYSPQPLSPTGYTQYFANLTRFNADHAAERDGTESSGFEFEVEYSTLDDEVYRLPDLTVRSYLKLAYRMGQTVRKAHDDGSLDGAEETLQLELRGGGEAEDAGTDVDASGKKHKKKKKKKDKEDKEEHNKTWLRFLQRAFVGTVPLDELR